LIVRDWYDIRRYDLTPEGRCPHCSTAIAGRFGPALGRNGKAFGPHRIPVHLGH
jgi:pyruvate formate lyase activating enzyme